MDGFGQRVREARERKGWNREELGVYSGISSNTVRSIELGLKVPRLSTATHIAEALGIPLASLLEEASA